MAPRPGPHTPDVGGTPIYRLRLFIAGDEPNSLQARESLARLCNEHLAGHCEVEVVDVLQDYEAAITHGVSLVPTLKVRGPRGELTIVGSLRDEAVVLAALGLSPPPRAAMSGEKPSYEELQQRLEQAEAALAALRRGEVDLVVGDGGPLLVRLKSLVEENERLAQQWQTTFDAVGDAILISDAEQRVLRANRAAEAAFSCPRSEMIGKRCCEIVHGTAAPIPECPFHRMHTSRQRERLETQLGDRWFVLTTDPLLDEAGRLTGVVHIARDITARKQAEQAQRESEAFLRSTLDALSSHIAVVDASGEIVLTNQAWRDFAAANGVDPGAVGEGTNYFTVCSVARGSSSEGAAIFGEAIRQVLAGSRSSYEMEYPCHVPQEERWFLGRVTPFSGPGPQRAVVCHENITARRQAEAALKEGRQYLQAVLDAINDAVFVDDADTGEIIDVNRGMCEMYGYSREEALRVSVSDLSLGEPPYSQAEALEWLRKTREIGPQTFEWVARHKDGHTFWVEVSTRFVVIAGHNRFVVIVRDITERKRADEALRESEEKFKALFDSANDGIFLMNRTTFLDCNATTEKIFQAPKSQIIGRSPVEFSPTFQPNGRLSSDLAKEKIDAAFSGAPQFFEWLHTRQDGTLFYAEVSLNRVFIGGEVLLQAIVRDITERKEAERKIRQSEETYRNLFQNAQVGLCRTRIEDGKILESNEQLARMFGYDSRERFIAEFSTKENYVDPGTRERLLELLRRDGFVANFEARFFRRDRSIIWVRYSARIYPEKGWIEGVAEDITAHKQAEAALRESEERFRRAVEHAPYPAAIYAEDGEVLLVNTEWTRITGYRREDIPTIEAWTEKAYGERQKLARGVIASLFAANGPIATPDTVIRCRDGATRTWSFRSTPLGRDERGRRLVLTMAVDMSERQLLEARLRQAQKMEAIGRLAGGVAHDFNNLLQAMAMAVYALRLRCPEVTKAGATAELEKYVKRGADLTRQLLLSSRRAQPQIEPCDVNGVVRRAESLLRRLLPENISVHAELAEGEVWVDGDPAQLEQVLMNLAVNARDAMPEGGRLVLSTGALSEGEVFIDVEDSGIGIPPEVRERIFEPFFTTKDQSSGTGLGLAVVHGIVTQHGGRVEVESEPGHGSRFRVVLPRRLALKEDRAVAEEAAAGPAAGGRGERVLVVEDEEGARQGLAEILALLGYQTTAVASAEEALALPEDPPFHALLTDLMLPGMTGGRLAKTLMVRWPELGVILMSGYPEDERVRGETPPGVRFLQKPFDIDALAQALRATLDARRG